MGKSTCPVCAAPLKPENVAGHMGRVHPHAPLPEAMPRASRRPKRPPRRLSHRREAYAYGIIAIVVVIIVVVALLPRGKERGPDFDLVDTEGASTRSSDFQGSFLVLDLMWTKCSWCQRFTRETLAPLYPSWESRVRFLSVDLNREGDSVEVGNARILAFKAEFGATWPYALDTDGLADRVGVTGTPTTLLIDREGYIVYRHNGYESLEDFSSQLNRFVGG